MLRHAEVRGQDVAALAQLAAQRARGGAGPGTPRRIMARVLASRPASREVAQASRSTLGPRASARACTAAVVAGSSGRLAADNAQSKPDTSLLSTMSRMSKHGVSDSGNLAL